MDGIKSERMPFVLIKLFTGGQFHINFNNIPETTFIIISVKQIKVSMFLTECSNRLRKTVSFWFNYAIVKPVRKKNNEKLAH